MLTPAQRSRIDAALEAEDRAALHDAVAQLATSEELHAFAYHYDWDDGAAGLWPVIEHPACDRGTALLVYWHTDGVFCLQPTEVRAHERDIYDLCIAIEQRLVNGVYTRQAIRFDPTDPADLDGDHRLLLARGKRPLPPEVLTATPGTRASWVPLPHV